MFLIMNKPGVRIDGRTSACLYINIQIIYHEHHFSYMQKKVFQRICLIVSLYNWHAFEKNLLIHNSCNVDQNWHSTNGHFNIGFGIVYGATSSRLYGG